MKLFFIFAAILVGMLTFATDAPAAAGTAVIKGLQASSKITGTARFKDTPRGLTISIRIKNAPPGLHGIHIHEFGSCEKGGKGAGGHYNPADTEHGDFEKDGPVKVHVGDLGNIKIDKDGSGRLYRVLREVFLNSGKYPVAGRGLILHARKDDFGQPTGRAGGRIACGAIIVTGN